MVLLHTKDVYLSFDVGLFNFNLYASNFSFEIIEKSTTVAQKGKMMETPFFTIPKSSCSFTTFISKQIDNPNQVVAKTSILSTLTQLGYENVEANVSVFDASAAEQFQRLSIFNDEVTIMKYSGIISRVQVVGTVGDYIQVLVEMNVSTFRHQDSSLLNAVSN